MTFDRRLRAALAALLLLFAVSLPAYAVVDRAVCSASDPGGASCTVAQLKAAINEEVNAVDNRAPMDLTSVAGTNTYTASVTPTLTSYTGPQAFWLKVPNANTGAATLNINTIGAKALVTAAGVALSANDLVITNIYLVRYYATADEFRIITALGSGSAAASNAYVTIGNTGALTAERALTAGTAIGVTDGGVNSTVTIAVNDGELTSIAGLTSAADKVPYYTGSGTAALADFSSAIRTLITTPSSANFRSLINDELGTGVLFFLGAPAADDQVFVSTSTSAGAWGSIPDSDAATQKLQYDVTTNAFSAGTDDDIPESGDFTNLALTGDVTSSGLATTVAANAVALTTDTTGNYVLDVADGTGIDGTAAAEGATYTPTLDLTELSSAVWGAGAFTTVRFDSGATDLVWTYSTPATVMVSGENTSPIFGLDDQGALRFLEEDAGGANYKGFQAPAAVTADTTCVFENDADFIPDSCVGDGSDDDVPEAGDFGALALTGDVTSSGLATTVAANAVALTADTTGNYMADIAAGDGIAVTHTPAEGSTGTIAFNYSDQGASPALAADACQFTSNATTPGMIVCEGDTADAFESRFVITDPTADRAFTIPNADSAAVQPLTCGGTDKVSAISALGVVTCTTDAGGAGSGDNISVNSSAATDANLDNADPAAPGGGVNVLWQLNTTPSPDNVSAYVPTSTFAMLAAANVFTSDQTITSTDAGATAGPTILLLRDSISPAVNDVLGLHQFQGKNDAATTKTYAKLEGLILDPTAGSEDGRFTIQTQMAGALTSQLLVADGAWLNGATGSNKGTGTINAQEYYKNGVIATRALICTLTTTSGTTQSCSSIPAYRELYIEVAGVSFSATVTMTLAVSDDNGANYGTARAISVATGSAAGVLYGTIKVSNIQTTDSLAVASSLTAIAATATATNLAVVMAEAGGAPAVINAIQFAGGTFDAGTIRVYGLL